MNSGKNNLLKTLFLLALCLALAGSLCAAEATGSNAPTLTLDNRWPELNRYVGLGNDFDGAWSWNLITDVEVLNWQEMRDYYGGSPVWTVERESGVDFAFYTNSEDYGSWGRVDVRSDDIGQAAGDEVLKITCDWGGQTEITRTTVHVLNAPNGLPTGLDYPREVSTQVGTTLTIAPSIMPAGWTLPGCTPSITFNGGEMEQFATQVTQSDTEAVFQVNTPGVFKALVMMSADTITIGHEVTFSVADENGNVPAAALDVGVNWYNGSDSERDFYLVPDYDGNMLPSRVQSTSAITSMWLNEFDSSSAAPVWSLTADAAEAQASLQVRNDGRNVTLRLDTMPSQEENAVFHLRCEYLDKVWSKDYTVHFKSLDSLPAGVTLSISNPMTVQTGDPIDVGFASFANGWSIPDENISVSAVSTNGSMFTWRNNSTIANEPGVYTMYVQVACGNIMWWEPVTLNIADENGNIPQFEMKVEAEFDYGMTYYIVPGFGNNWYGEDNILSNDQMGSIYISNQNECYNNLQGNNIIWEITPEKLEYPRIELERWGTSADLRLVEMPDDDVDAKYTITCDWDTAHWEHELTVRFRSINGALPTGIETDFGDILTVTTGTPSDLTARAHFKDNWQISGETVRAYILRYYQGSQAVVWSSALQCEAFGEPGVYEACLMVECANVQWSKLITLNIADANGSVPALVPEVRGVNELELVAGIPMLDETKERTPGSMNYVTDFHITNYSLLEKTYGGTPTWTITRTSGTAAFRYEAFGDYDSSLEFYIDSVPAQPETSVYHVKVTWGGQSWEDDLILQFKNYGQPAGIETNLGKALVVKAGVPFSVRGGVVRFLDDWQVPGRPVDAYFADGQDSFLRYAGWNSNYIVDDPGVYTIHPHVYSANLVWIDTLTLYVVDANGVLPENNYPAGTGNVLRLPANLTEIGSQAFANLPNLTEVDIPIGVTSIAADAFDGCGLLILHCKSDYAVDYALEHEFIPVR